MAIKTGGGERGGREGKEKQGADFHVPTRGEEKREREEKRKGGQL